MTRAFVRGEVAGCVGAGGGGGSSKFSSSADNDHAEDSADNGGTVGRAGSWTVAAVVAELPADSELLTAPAGLGEADLLTRAARSPPTTAVTCCR